jgi:hypothetical protein
MDISPQYENEVRRLLQIKQRAEAVRYLQNALNVSNSDADLLVHAVEHEITQEQQKFLKNTAIQTKGCGAVLLKIISFGFGFFGLGFMVLGIGAYLLFNYVEPGSVEVQGHVVQLTENESGSLAPVIDYEWNGETKTYRSEVYSSPPDFEVGQVVSVWVNPENPNNATVVQAEMGWIFISVFGGIGLFFCVIAIVLYRIGKKMNS